MEEKQFFNELPRPTFRWTKVNHMESELWPIDIHTASVTLTGDTHIVRDLEDNTMLQTSYKGANEKALIKILNECESAFHIVAPAGEKKQVAFHIKLDNETPNQLLRIRISAEEESNLEVLLLCESTGTAKGAFHVLTEVEGNQRSQILIKKVQMLNEVTQQIEHRIATLADEAQLEYINVEVGGLENIYNYETDLSGAKSHLGHRFAYLGDGEQRFDISMVMNHGGVKSTSDIHNLGALTGTSKKSFRGTLDFLRGCIGAEGSEEDTCLLLNDKVKSISLPLLLCKEDNVVGNHAASAGQIEANKLFYLMSRGFSEDEAKHILVESMLRPIIDQIGDETIEENILSFIRKRI